MPSMCEFNPPETVLYQVAVNVRILLVEVGHGRYKPAVVHLVGIVLGSIRVYVRGQFEGGLHEVVFVVGVVEPIFGGHVLNPYMLYAAVVENHVHYDFDAACMGFFNQLLVFFVGTEARVYLVVVCGGIAVIGTAGLSSQIPPTYG